MRGGALRVLELCRADDTCMASGFMKIYVFSGAHGWKVDLYICACSCLSILIHLSASLDKENMCKLCSSLVSYLPSNTSSSSASTQERGKKNVGDLNSP